ncbi:MAG TPA: hypothetical protein VGF34_17775 [Stellaceae bacterium]|jgi:hypothetical protein
MATTPRPRAPIGAAPPGVVFEYRGGGVLTVIGQATGRQYRFVGHGARVAIDLRDRTSLTAVPALREVTPHQ